MKRRWVALMMALGLGLSLNLGCPSSAAAEQVYGPVQKITVHGVVPERRMIVVDEQDRIRLVTSNTPNNIAPEVHLMSLGGMTVPMTDDVRQTYEKLLRKAPGDKAVTITPAPEPLEELFPSFINHRPAALYLITPARPEFQPFWTTE